MSEPLIVREFIDFGKALILRKLKDLDNGFIGKNDKQQRFPTKYTKTSQNFSEIKQ